MKYTVCRKEHFNAAHRLFNPAWSDEENERIFGKCANKNWHGHNYELIVKITGSVNPDTGYVYDMKVLSDLIRHHVTDKLDHKNLNMDVPEFSFLIPSAEHIAKVIYDILRKVIEQKFEIKVVLYETERNFVEYPA